MYSTKYTFLTFNKILLLTLLSITLVFSSCTHKQENTKSANNKKEKNERFYIDKKLLAGSWKDNSDARLDFTLFEDGSARSDNMKTLLYKKWVLNKNQVTFTIESIGNGQSFINKETYTITHLSQEKLILKKGDFAFTYTRKK